MGIRVQGGVLFDDTTGKVFEGDLSDAISSELTRGQVLTALTGSSALGTANQILKVNGGGTAIAWAADAT